MKCLNREDIQLLLDNELEQGTVEAYRQHIAGCEHCQQLYKQATEEKALLSAFFSTYDEVLETQEIPVFVKPRKSNIRWILRVAACAVAILGLTFGLFYNNSPKVEKKLPVVVKNTDIEIGAKDQFSVTENLEKQPASVESTSYKRSQKNQFPLEELDHNQQWHQMREQGVSITIVDNVGNIIYEFTSIN